MYSVEISESDEESSICGELHNLNLAVLQNQNESKDGYSYKELIENQRSPITHGNREKPEISLTFDDGYGPENIRHILDTLEGSGIRATFFVLGQCLKNNPNLRKEAVDEGHQVCCHTFSHIYLSNDSDITTLGAGLNKEINPNKRMNDVINLLGDDYLDKIKAESGTGFPHMIKSDLLLETEILMREAQVKLIFGDGYLQDFKKNYPFFRFPGGRGATRNNNVNVLKKLGYLSIGWSDDFYRGTGKSRRHMSVDDVKKMEISNGDIPLFHFKKNYKMGQPTEREYIDAYIENMKNRNKTSHEVSQIIK